MTVMAMYVLATGTLQRGNASKGGKATATALRGGGSAGAEDPEVATTGAL